MYVSSSVAVGVVPKRVCGHSDIDTVKLGLTELSFAGKET